MARSAELRDDELLIDKMFDAPAALVFRLWSDPVHFVRWWGPKGFTCPSAKLDFRVGGRFTGGGEVESRKAHDIAG